MKKILGMTMLTLFFTCCEVGVKNSNAGTVITDDFYDEINEVHEEKLIKDEVEYYIYYQYKGGLAVVNHTKELLEIELLKLQIDSLKSR